MFYHVTIWVLRDVACHLKRVCNGSLLYTWLAFTSSLLFFHLEHATGKKLAKLKKVVGESREGEEELEGEVVVGPSRDAVVYSSGNIPLLFFLTNHFINYNILLHYWVNSHLESYFSLISWPILFADESDEEGEVMAETKEEEDLGVVQSWMQVGGLPALPEEEVQGLLCEVSPLFFLSHSLALACNFHSPCI